MNGLFAQTSRTPATLRPEKGFQTGSPCTRQVLQEQLRGFPSRNQAGCPSSPTVRFFVFKFNGKGEEKQLRSNAGLQNVHIRVNRGRRKAARWFRQLQVLEIGLR
jgi:hypothetical protein